MQEHALCLEIVICFATKELQIAIRLMNEKENRRTILDVLAGKTALVGGKRVACKADVRCGHMASMAQQHECPLGRRIRTFRF